MNPMLASTLLNKDTIKTVGIIAGVGVAGYAGWRIYRNWKENKDKRKFSRQLNQLQVTRRNLNYDQTDYDLMVQDLLSAMDGSGTRESTIVSIFTQPNMNRDDLLKLIKDFGIREYGNTGKPGWWSRNLWGEEPLNLIGWLKAEMTDSELERVRLVFRQNNIPF